MRTLGRGSSVLAASPMTHTMGPKKIDRDRVRELTAQDAQLIEVLPSDEFEKEHVAGARNIPLKEFEERHDELDQARPVIVYCEDSL